METSGDGKLSPGALQKKLKQTRLPFQVLSASPTSDLGKPISKQETRKRKPSLSGDEARAAKIGRISEVKENVIKTVTTIEVLDDSNEAIAATSSPSPKTPKAGASKERKSTPRIQIKLPISNKKKSKRKNEEEETPTKEGKSAKQKKAKPKPKVNKIKVDSTKIAAKSIDDCDMISIEDSDLSSDEEESGMIVNITKKDASVENKPEVSANGPELDVEKGGDDGDAILDLNEENKVRGDKEATNSNDKEEEEAKQAQEADKNHEIVEKNIKEDSQADEGGKTEKKEKKSSKREEKSAKKTPTAEKRKSTRVVKKTPDVVKVVSPVVKKKAKGKLDLFLMKKTENNIEKKEEKVVEPVIKKSAKTGEKSSKKEKKNEAVETEVESVDKSPEKEAPLSESSKIEKTPEKKRLSKEKSKGSSEKKNTSTEESPEESPDTGEKIEDANESISKEDTLKSILMDDSCNEEDIYMLCTPNSKSVLTAEEKLRKLTPKQLARKKEFEVKAQIKLQEKEERRKKFQEEKEARHREKDEAERLKKKEREEKEEQRKKEREEKEDLKRKEKEEREKKRLVELEQKSEEKRLKDEERKKKDEQKEEERKKKEEERQAVENKKKKAVAAFTNFFVKKKNDPKMSDDENSVETTEAIGFNLNFMPFCVKGDMRLAPTVRKVMPDDRKKSLENILKNKLELKRKNLYLSEIKKATYTSGKCERTWIPAEEDEDEDDIVFIGENVGQQIEVDPEKPKQTFRAKYLLFEENRRPPYRGTWRKKSAEIHARKPFALDKKYFDYEVDSDDEWEEEEPGESLHGSDDEKDVDPEEDYEVDNDFFVPHGHLSDEEMQEEDEVMEDNTPETQKAKLKILQQEFAAEMKKKTEKIKPRLIGCIWENNNTKGENELPCSAVIWEILKVRAMLFDTDEPIVLVNPKQVERESTSPVREIVNKRIKIPEESVAELIKLVHGNVNGKKFLVKEFQAYRAKNSENNDNSAEYTGESIATKIRGIATWKQCTEEGVMHNKMCWLVPNETLIKYGVEDLKVPNSWEYLLQRVKRKPGRKVEAQKPSTSPTELKINPTECDPVPPQKSATKTPSGINIKKFTKILSADEKKKQFASIEISKEKEEKPVEPTQPKKRVQLLMSVPRGQKNPETKKNNLISQFLQNKPDKLETPMEVDTDVIVLE